MHRRLKGIVVIHIPLTYPPPRLSLQQYNESVSHQPRDRQTLLKLIHLVISHFMFIHVCIIRSEGIYRYSISDYTHLNVCTKRKKIHNTTTSKIVLHWTWLSYHWPFVAIPHWRCNSTFSLSHTKRFDFNTAKRISVFFCFHFNGFFIFSSYSVASYRSVVVVCWFFSTFSFVL